MAQSEQGIQPILEKSVATDRVRTRYSWRRRFSTLLLYVVALLGALAFSLPFFWTVSSSLKPASEIYMFPPTIWPEQIRWQNYVDVFRLAPFARFIWNTVVITAFAMIGQILSAAAWPLASRAFAFPVETRFL
ncbi:MAG: carbohydrate ABC transporter permease [Caldilineaceae bacterium]|nr:carbohydrate ABC transporter permease [Caldilineaceae bacterium]